MARIYAKHNDRSYTFDYYWRITHFTNLTNINKPKPNGIQWEERKAELNSLEARYSKEGNAEGVLIDMTAFSNYPGFTLKKYLDIVKKIIVEPKDLPDYKQESLQRCVNFIENFFEKQEAAIQDFIKEHSDNKDPEDYYNASVHLKSFLFERAFRALVLIEGIFEENIAASIVPNHIFDPFSPVIIEGYAEYPQDSAEMKKQLSCSDPMLTEEKEDFDVVDTNRAQAQQLQDERAKKAAQKAKNERLNPKRVDAAGRLGRQQDEAPRQTIEYLTIGGDLNAALTLAEQQSNLIAAVEQKDALRKQQENNISKAQQAERSRKIVSLAADIEARKDIKPPPQIYSPGLFSQPQSAKSYSPQTFNKIKRLLENTCSLNIIGTLNSKGNSVAFTSNGLLSAILSHYDGGDISKELINKITTDVKEEDSLQTVMEKVLSAVSLQFKSVLIISPDNTGTEFEINDDFCDKNMLISSLDKPYTSDTPFFIFNYPDTVGPRYYSVSNLNKGYKAFKLGDILSTLTQRTEKVSQSIERIPNTDFYTVKTPAEGDCLFIAIAKQLDTNAITATTLRNNVADAVEKDPACYKDLITGDHQVDFNFYLANIRKPKILWGGHIEISILEEQYKRPFIILHADKEANLSIVNLSVLNIEQIKSEKIQPIWLLYTGGSHYDQLSFQGDNINDTLDALVDITMASQTGMSLK